MSSAFYTVDHRHIWMCFKNVLLLPLRHWHGSSRTFLTAYKSFMSLVSRHAPPLSVAEYCGAWCWALQRLSCTLTISTRSLLTTHCYADDTQTYILTQTSQVQSIALHLQRCFTDVADWCRSRQLQLNAAKTELMWFISGSPYAESKSLIGSYTV